MTHLYVINEPSVIRVTDNCQSVKRFFVDSTTPWSTGLQAGKTTITCEAHINFIFIDLQIGIMSVSTASNSSASSNSNKRQRAGGLSGRDHRGASTVRAAGFLAAKLWSCLLAWLACVQVGSTECAELFLEDLLDHALAPLSLVHHRPEPHH